MATERFEGGREEGNIEMDEEEERNEDVVSGNEKPERFTKLPLTRIKYLMKLDPDVTMASQEAVILVAKATELFIECLAKESYTFTTQNKKKTIQRKDVDCSIDAVDALVFLEGALE